MNLQPESLKNITFELNNKKIKLEIDPSKPLLWVIRDELKIKGTKYSCGLSTCGACTVHLNGQPVRSCILPISQCQDQKITTIEGLSDNGTHPVQKAWIDADVPQCGYCQSGQLMQAAALLEKNATPDEATVNRTMSQVLCRCGTYPRIKKAIALASNLLTLKEAK